MIHKLNKVVFDFIFNQGCHCIIVLNKNIKTIGRCWRSIFKVLYNSL